MKNFILLLLLPFYCVSQENTILIKYQAAFNFSLPTVSKAYLYCSNESSFYQESNYLPEVEKDASIINYPETGTIKTILNDSDGISLIFENDASTLKIKDQFEAIKWSIKEEEKSILGYTARLATCIFRGREYKAYFAKDIPIQFGPWKFSGLPGLILEIYDVDNQVRFTAIKINKIERVIFEDNLFSLKKIPYSDVSYKDFLKMKSQAEKEEIRKIIANLGRGNNLLDISTSKTKNSGIELSYEWEEEEKEN